MTSITRGPEWTYFSVVVFMALVTSLAWSLADRFLEFSVSSLSSPSSDHSIACASPFVLFKVPRGWLSVFVQPFLVVSARDFFSTALMLFVFVIAASSASSLDGDHVLPVVVSVGKVSGSKRQNKRYLVHELLVVYLLYLLIRTGLGYVFFRGFGFAYPSLFFHSSFYDCSGGLWPILLTWILSQRISLNSVGSVAQVASCLLVVVVSNASVWTVVSCVFGALSFALVQRGRLDVSTLCIVSLVMLVFYASCPLTPATSDIVLFDVSALFSNHMTLLSMVIVTAPRRGDARYLLETIDSLTGVFPRAIDDALYERVDIAVYTGFPLQHHVVFREAFERHHHVETEPFVSFVSRGELLTPSSKLLSNSTIASPRNIGNQLDHFSQAIYDSLKRTDAAFVMIIEDDFPICPDSWPEILRLFQLTFSTDSLDRGPCGLFIGSGGSGLLMRRDIASVILKLLLMPEYQSWPADIVMQQCLRGLLPECGRCASIATGMVVSDVLLMHHVGFNTSTFDKREYGADQFQCGWRHPLNGELGVRVIPISSHV